VEPNNQAAKIMVASKPINFYAYSTLLLVAMTAFGLLMAFVSGDMKGGVLKVVLITVAAIQILYMLRFIIIRNHESTRVRIMQTNSSDEAWRIIFGGYSWGLIAFVVVAATFYFSLQMFVL
jgi:hypothetical protein